jgi:hypothetical protein
VDYLGLVQAAHEEAITGQIAYRSLPGLEALAPAAGQAPDEEPEARP